MSDHEHQPIVDGESAGETSTDTKSGSGPIRRRSRSRRQSFFGRHKALTVMLSLFGVLGLLLAGAVFYLNGKLGQIDRVPITLPENVRPQQTSGESMNILLAGVDNGDGFSIAEALAEENWTVGRHRSDTIMILHISADRRSAYLVSIPRDSYVPIYDGNGERAGTHKMNAAFSLYGPSGYVSTIEHLTDVRMEHLAMIDWAGFRDLTTALGGVRVYVPETVYNNGRVTWEQGYQQLYGDEALRYVRTRYGLSGGDFDRIRRQQNFLRALMQQVTSGATLANPFTLRKVLDAVTKNLTVDDGWSNGELRSLALDMRHIRPADVTFLTAPLAADWNHSIPGEGDVVYLDKEQCAQLWQALADDTVAEYAAAHEKDQLPDMRHVN